MKLLKQYPLLLTFVVFLAVVSVSDLFATNRQFSEMENRYLKQQPKLTLSSLVAKNGEDKYTRKYEDYINDQFIGRDGWITIKSVNESLLMKIENNGIVYGKDHHMFEYYPSVNEQRLEMNIGQLSEFLKAYGTEVPTTVAVIPNSYEVLKEGLPAGLKNVDQQARIAEIYGKLPGTAQKLDLLPVMRQAAADANLMNPNSLPGTEVQTYYRTDHHWTTYGAYHAYRAFVESKGMRAVGLEELDATKFHVADFYGSYYSKCKLFSAVPDTIDVYDVPFSSITVDGEGKTRLNDMSKWETRDKHAAFLWGNNGVTVIKSENNRNRQEGKTSRILLIKDSYGNSFAPFLTYNYDEVWVVDLRSLTMESKMSDLIHQNEFDELFVMYNFMNFASDTNFMFLNR